MALAWSIRYFLVALLAGSARSRAVVGLAVRPFTWWLPRLDRLLKDRPAALDAASGTALVARRRDSPVPDTEVIGAYRGLCRTPRSY
jgi:hypothetical protein